LANQLAREVRKGRSIQEVGLFGSQTVVVGAGLSNAGRPRLSFRLMVSLLYLKHAYNERDEGLIECWSETPTWQSFSSLDYFEHRVPCDPTLIGKFRKLIGKEGLEELLAKNVAVAVNLKLIGKKALESVVVDATVQPKAVAHPTDSRLLRFAAPSWWVYSKRRALPLSKLLPKKARC
jgi:IS5 family transposase